MPPANLPKDRLRLAIQKSGRLSTDSLDLLKACGIKIKSPKEKLLLHADNFPLDLLFVRDDDIPQLVMDGVCDLGIVGQNVLEESALERGTTNAYVAERVLDFGGCRLAIALPEERPYSGLKDLAGLRIATSYPQLTKRYLAQQGVSAEVVTLKKTDDIWRIEIPLTPRHRAIFDELETNGQDYVNRLDVVKNRMKTDATTKDDVFRDLLSELEQVEPNYWRAITQNLPR